MTGFAVVLLFGSAFLFAVWTLVVSIRPYAYRFRELFGAAVVPAPMALAPTRVTVRYATPAPRRLGRFPLRAAA